MRSKKIWPNTAEDAAHCQHFTSYRKWGQGK